MEPIVFDWDEIESGTGFDLIPPGAYPVAITKLELRESREMRESGGASGFPFINVELTVQEGEHKGRKLWDIWSLNPKAIRIGLGGAMPAFGVKMGGTANYGTYAEMCDSLFPRLQGAQAVAIVKHEVGRGEYEGRVSERIKAYKPSGSVATPAAPTGLI